MRGVADLMRSTPSCRLMLTSIFFKSVGPQKGNLALRRTSPLPSGGHSKRSLLHPDEEPSLILRLRPYGTVEKPFSMATTRSTSIASEPCESESLIPNDLRMANLERFLSLSSVDSH